MSPALSLGNPALRQFLRFGIVGVANTATCLGIIWAIEGLLGWPVWLASGLGYTFAMAQSYLVNRSWTFAGGAPLPVGAQLVRFILVNIGVGVIFSLMTTALAPHLGVRVASLAVLVPITLLSFFATRRFVFSAS
jgi:putative flippase GtrA